MINTRLRKYRYFHGQVTLAVLKVLAQYVRHVTCQVKLNDYIDEPMSVDRAEFIERLEAMDDDEVFWVMWRRNTLSIDEAMSEESAGHFPAEVWKDIDQEPPRKKK